MPREKLILLHSQCTLVEYSEAHFFVFSEWFVTKHQQQLQHQASLGAYASRQTHHDTIALNGVNHNKLKLKGKATPQPDSNTPAPTTRAITLAKVASLELTASEAPRETAPAAHTPNCVRLAKQA